MSLKPKKKTKKDPLFYINRIRTMRPITTVSPPNVLGMKYIRECIKGMNKTARSTQAFRLDPKSIYVESKIVNTREGREVEYRLIGKVTKAWDGEWSHGRLKSIDLPLNIIEHGNALNENAGYFADLEVKDDVKLKLEPMGVEKRNDGHFYATFIFEGITTTKWVNQ